MYRPVRSVLLVTVGAVAAVAPFTALQPAHAATSPFSNPICSTTFPNSSNLRVLSVSSGRSTSNWFGGLGYIFTYTQFTGNSLNVSAQQALNTKIPAGDSLVIFRLQDQKYNQVFTGIANSFQQSGSTYLCLKGTAYLNLGNGSQATYSPAAVVSLTGTVQSIKGRVDMHVGKIHYFVFGPLHGGTPVG